MRAACRLFAQTLAHDTYATRYDYNTQTPVYLTSLCGRGDGERQRLRKAGIGYHEVVAGHTTAGKRLRLVEKLVPGV